MATKKTPEKPNVSKEELLKYYSEMLLIRRFEEKAGQLYGMGLIGGFCHLYIGQEAVVVGLEAATKDGDKRILMIDGEPVPYCLARIPAAGETRGNLAAGGRVQEARATHSHHASAAMSGAVEAFNEQLERLAELAIVLIIGAMLPYAMPSMPHVGFIALLLLVLRPLAVLAGVCYNFCVYFAAEPQLMGQNPALYENVSRLVQFWL